MVVYVIRNRIDGMEYVGTTVQPLSYRLSSHRQRSRDKKTRSPLHAAARELGWDQFEVTAVETAASYDDLLVRERRAIAERNTVWPNGYNLVKGGRGNLGWRMSEDTRKKIAAARVGREPWNKGRPMDDETKAKLSRAKTGRCSPALAAVLAARAKRPVRDETKAKMSAAQKGVPKNAAYFAAVAGLKRTDATKARCSEAKKLWWATRTAEQRAAMSAAIAHGSTRRAATA